MDKDTIAHTQVGTLCAIYSPYKPVFSIFQRQILNTVVTPTYLCHRKEYIHATKLLKLPCVKSVIPRLLAIKDKLYIYCLSSGKYFILANLDDKYWACHSN